MDFSKHPLLSALLLSLSALSYTLMNRLLGQAIPVLRFYIVGCLFIQRYGTSRKLDVIRGWQFGCDYGILRFALFLSE